MKKRDILGIIGVLIVLIALSGCSNQEDTIKIGYSAALSGDIASIGQSNYKGVQLAVNEINNKGGINSKKVELIVLDDAFDEKQTISNYKRLTEIENVDVFLSTTYGGILGVSKSADEEKVVVINSLDASNEMANAGEYVFGIGIYDEGIGYSIADFVVEDFNDKNAALIYNKDDPFIALVKDAFVERYEELGGEIRVRQSYSSTTADFKTQLLQIKNAQPKTLVVVGFEEQGLLLRQAKDLDLEVQIIGIDTMSAQAVKETAQDALEGVYFTFWDPQTQEVKEFKEEFLKEYKQEPSQLLFSVTGYDATMMTALALEQNIPLKDALHQISYNGVAGHLMMSDDGIVRSIREEIFRFENGEIVRAAD